jgi:hypothetical protein
MGKVKSDSDQRDLGYSDPFDRSQGPWEKAFFRSLSHSFDDLISGEVATGLASTRLFQLLYCWLRRSNSLISSEGWLGPYLGRIGEQGRF